MISQDAFALTAAIAVCVYYLSVWRLIGGGRKLGTVVTQYAPPRNLSPAMLRYIWKERFDDRTFWAGVLSLVAKGFATLHSEDGTAFIRATPNSDKSDKSPREEQILLTELVGGRRQKGTALNMLNARTAQALSEMAKSLRRDAVGLWFKDNRPFLIAGIILSVGALCFVADPQNHEQWGALILGLAVMAPGAFYLFFISQRLWDGFNAAKQSWDWAVLRRETLLLAMSVPCVAAIILGSVVVGGTLGWQSVALVFFLASLNAYSSRIKIPTPEGRQVLIEIEGFRHFLQSVEQLPMQRNDKPSDRAGAYEQYLPYALALGVEQAWGDRFVALGSTYHEGAEMRGAEAFYLGTWGGKPLEIIYKPEAPKGRSF